eukprot:sb/3471756/
MSRLYDHVHKGNNDPIMGFLKDVIMDLTLIPTHHCLRSLAHQYLNTVACSPHALAKEATRPWMYSICGDVKSCREYPLWSWMSGKAMSSQIVGKFRFCTKDDTNPGISHRGRPTRQFDVRTSLTMFRTVLCTKSLQREFYLSFPGWNESNELKHEDELLTNLLILDCICCVVTVLMQS